MAAEPTRIKLKRSTTATVVPTTSNLADGEVAVNIADRKIYVRNGGSIVEVANQKPNTGEVTTSMLATDITNGPGNTYYVASTGSNSNTLGNSGANGKHPDTPFLTVAKALSVATAGDTVNIAAGTYQEVFPLTVPDGVTLRGANLRSTQITPTPATNDLNAFILQGDCHVSDLTVKDFFYNSGNDTGYGFVCASSLDSDRSPYIERVSVITKGSVTSASDPYGFAQGDAGRGAKLDGAVFSANTIETAVLFNEVTFIVPNSVGLLLTNGVRVEWLNSFVYFAAEGIKGEQGATGRAGAGQTRLKLAGVSGTFSAAEVIYQLEDSFQSGTYSRTGTTVTITKTAHGLVNGDLINADFISGTATDGYYIVANSAANTFDVTDTASGTTSGNITFKKADAYGTITTNDGTYLLINGKGVGEFTTGVPTGKTGVIAGDAQLDTAQQKFGTASLVLDGVTDHLSYPTSEDFGFGTTNFAFECFIRPTATTGTQYFLDFRDGSDTDTAPTMYLDGTTLHFGVGNTSQISGGTLSAGTWYHVAAARSGGTTKLFLDGAELGTYTDSNDYGATKPLGIGGEYGGTNEFGGHIDEVRVSKASARYTGAFTAPTAAFTTDLYTVLLLHFDGTDGSTTITDSGKGVKDIRSSGGDSATSLLTADYAQFGAELRSISSANIYGTKGAIADGAGVKLLLTAHNFAYIGSGADFTNDPDLAVPANEVTELNGGRIFYSATNEKGDFRIGDAFVVDQETGNVQFQSTSTAQEAANITLSDPTGTTRIFPAFVETGNLRLSGNTLSSTSGNVIVDPSANEDILLNAETIIPEKLYFESSKLVAIESQVDGSLSYVVDGNEVSGFSSYGLFSNKNLTVYSLGIDSITIVNEGSEYPAQLTNVEAKSNPINQATATVSLNSTGGVASVTLTNKGSGYTTPPNITVAAPPGGNAATVSAVLSNNTGKVVQAIVGSPGSGYTSPTITFDDPQPATFDTLNSVNANADTITIVGHGFAVNDTVIYSDGLGTQNIGLTDGNTYYIVATTEDTIKLSSSQGGAAINLLSVGTSEVHSIRGTTATGTISQSAGALTTVTITNPGVGYTGSPTATISDPTGIGGFVNTTVGFSIAEVTIGDSGSGYSSAPSFTITNGAGDTTGSGLSLSATLGYSIDTVTLTNSGRGYSIVPDIILTGGNPSQDAILTPVFDKKSGQITSITIDDGGQNYTTTPTLVISGGEGSDAQLQLSILPLGGTISVGGSGYKAGTYDNVDLIVGGVGTPATATISVVGLSGTLSGGSGYTEPIVPFTAIKVRNTPTSTFAITTQSRAVLNFRYSDSDDYEWNVVNNGSTSFDFTRVSPTGTASGSNISISAEKGDILTLNMSASGHPFYIQTTAAPYDINSVVNTDITGNGSDVGTIVWNLKDVEPGTYYYVCANHPAMTGTITVSAYSGSTFNVSDTITGSSGVSGTLEYIDGFYARLSGVSGGGGSFFANESISNGTVTATTNNNQTIVNSIFIDGVESPSQAILTHNSYNFDLSDSSLSGVVFDIQGNDPDTYAWSKVGIEGSAGAVGYLTVKTTFNPSTNYLYYGQLNSTGSYFNESDGSGSPGEYGFDGQVTIDISAGGAIDTWTFTDQGSGYKIGDVLRVDSADVGGTGSGATFTITANDTSISSVTNISTSGGPYSVGDIVTVNSTFDGVGSGGGFQFSVTKVGYLDSITIQAGGFGFYQNKDLYLPASLSTTGTPILLRVNTVSNIIPIEVQYDGGITSQNWSIDKDGNTSLGSSSLTCGNISSSSISSTGSISAATSISSSTLSVGTSATISNLTANGNSLINNATTKFSNGTAAAPTLTFQNSASTGLYRAGNDDIGLSISGIQRGSISASGFDLSTDFVVDQNLAEITPFFRINPVGESVDIGAATTQLRINNDASIEAIGSDADVDITFIPKGTGNLVLTGGVDKDFSITDGSTETFKVDTDSGNTTVGGRLDINGNIRIEDNIISSTIAQNATTSFGQIITISATGTGTGFTDNTYTAVTSTSNGSGTGATFDVTVSGGDITVITINAGGAGYAEGEEITLNPATVGAGTGKTITVTDIEGAGLVLKPQNGKNVKVDSTAMFVVPSGTTNQRPPSGDRQIGGVRFNTEQQQFEGYNGTDFVSLGGVRDVNQDTYILTELAPGTNEDTFFFYNQGVNSLDITQDKFKLYTAKTFDTSGTLTLNGVTIGSDSLDVQTLGSSVLKVRSEKDLEVTGGLRFKSVPVLGEISTIGSITSGTGVYTSSTTFNGVTSSSQFEGGGATFDIVVDGSGSIQSISLVSAGSGYEVGEIITIAGSLLGGATPANDVTFPVATLTNTTGTFARLDILQQDYVTQLDSKPFLSLDANGAQAAWKINRGWNAGTESYLTVMDSTADFVELDDCRVEGGQLTSFTASSTIVQFDKTAYKGAKTLVTIESDDGKVHMLEVTSVCAAAGTNAYATVTNSVTSDNDLVDASIAVIGNNVQVTVTKSSAATSSTTFTGRFTTTKVKV